MEDLLLSCIFYGVIFLVVALGIKYIKSNPQTPEDLVDMENPEEENLQRNQYKGMSQKGEMQGYEDKINYGFNPLIMHMHEEQSQRSRDAESQRSMTNFLLFLIVIELGVLIYFAYYNYSIQSELFNGMGSILKRFS